MVIDLPSAKITTLDILYLIYSTAENLATVLLLAYYSFITLPYIIYFYYYGC
jgi:hypothetical protein